MASIENKAFEFLQDLNKNYTKKERNIILHHNFIKYFYKIGFYKRSRIKWMHLKWKL